MNKIKSFTEYMILILNCGSQSIKWKLFSNNLKLRKEGRQKVFNSKNYQKILVKELNQLNKYQKKINAVGHRVVHGGKEFRKPTKITKKVLKKLEKFNKFAPLHNPFNILGIKVGQKLFPGVSQIAVFDTEFYANLPKKAYIYPLPANIRKKYRFRRFGFHGISHEYVAKTAAKKIKKPFENLKIITCHLGGGSSITAVKNGKSVDTSMGFTPMEGLVMMTRTGDIDPGIVIGLAQKFSLKRINKLLNFESGLKGISGSSEMLEVLKKIKKGNKKAKLALEIFVYRIQKYIGAYFAILDGCDLLVFTGTIGFGSAKIRNMICKNLNILRPARQSAARSPASSLTGEVGRGASRRLAGGNTKVLAIETDEELAIAQKIMKGL